MSVVLKMIGSEKRWWSNFHIFSWNVNQIDGTFVMCRLVEK